MSTIEHFVGQYPVSKTLRFELKPVLLENQTIDDFWDVYLNGAKENVLHKLYMHDKERNDNYPIMKAILDQFHKRFIASALEQFEVGKKGVSWDTLALAYQNDKKSNAYQKLQDEMRKKIRKAFEKHEWWPYVSSYSQLIGSLMEQLVENDDDFVESVQESNPKMELNRSKMLKAIRTFKRFSIYFGNYQDNRDNMYSEKDQTTSIANRIVNENFPKFIDNIVVYRRLKEVCPNELNVIYNTPDFSDQCISQIKNY